MNLRELSRGIHLDWVATGGADENTLAGLVEQLTQEEKRVASRYRMLKDRVAFATARVLLRRGLSACAAQPAGGWALTRGEYGKPELAPSEHLPDLRFNISHCSDLVIVGFALARPIGVDVERIDRAVEYREIARSVFSSDEIRLLGAMRDEEIGPAFFGVWTLKEAYVKARGMGLSIPLAEFSCSIGPPRIAFSDTIEDSSLNWFLWQRYADSAHVVAVAARRTPGEDLEVRWQETPLNELI